jgi:8-oxo-dGTP pyrophosphatase MutT (NUDIX family)
MKPFVRCKQGCFIVARGGYDDPYRPLGQKARQNGACSPVWRSVNAVADDSPGDDASAFFARAAARLAVPARVANAPSGDHALNPGMPVGVSYRDAAVLIPVLTRSPPSVLFTLRTPRLAAHAGQVSFPGGKIDPLDHDPVAAALRESEEEIGLDPASVTVVGALDPYLTATGFRIVPVLGRVTPPPSFRVNPEEVAEIFEVPLAVLMTPGRLARKSRVLGDRERHFYEMEYAGHTIWGATAGIIMSLYHRLYD